MSGRHAIRIFALWLACFGLFGPIGLIGLTESVGAESQRVENFALLDHEGRFHELHALADRRAIVLFVQGNGCPISRGAWPALRALRDQFAKQGVAFLLLNASPQDGRAAVAAEANEYGIDLPILLDETQLVAEALEVERTAEAIVIDPKHWRIVYRGPVDDRLDYGVQRPAREQYLRDALAALLGGREVETARRSTPGCLIQIGPKVASPTPISYSEEVAPILERRCRTCHTQGGVAPWAMSSYAMVAGWAPMMRETIRTRRMPPWHADPHFGRFANDIALTREEARTLVHWVEAGARRGEGTDSLAVNEAPPIAEWPLGPPDLVIEGGIQEVPAGGVVPYRYQTVDLPLEEDVWIRGVDLRPTNPAVTHHAIAWIEYASGHEPPHTEGPRFTRGFFAGYVPGRDARPFPKGTGYFLPAGSRIRFQLHYTTTGRAETDTPRMALYLSHDPLDHELKIGAAASFDFEIPPGAADHTEHAEVTLERDILLYRLTPHMHLRGKRMTIDAHTPDGRVERLLSVPRYDFNWQRQYVLSEPVILREGTRLVVEAAFDNSAGNPANPDPSATVSYGEQTFDEMLFGYFLYRDLTEGLALAARVGREVGR